MVCCCWLTDCGCAPVIKDSVSLFLWEIIIGGRYVPAALIVTMTVTVVPHSLSVTFPTRLTPFVAMILPGFWIFVMPVSATFQILFGEWL